MAIAQGHRCCGPPGRAVRRCALQRSSFRTPQQCQIKILNIAQQAEKTRSLKLQNAAPCFRLRRAGVSYNTLRIEVCRLPPELRRSIGAKMREGGGKI